MRLLKRVFGPSQNQVWRDLSDQIGAVFVKGGFFGGSSKVQANVNNWTVTLDTFTVSTGKSSVTYTRMRARFIDRDGFRFTIHRKKLLSGLGKFLGMQDVEVGGPKFDRLEPLFGAPGYLDPQVIESGDPDFDSDFIIKGNDEAKVKSLFKRLRVRELIQSQPAILLQIKGTGGWLKGGRDEGVAELYFQVTGVIKDLGRLKQLFELFGEVLKALHSSGSASDEPVQNR